MDTKTIKLTCDASPILSLIESIDRTIQSGERLINLGNIPTELVRVESDQLSAGAGEVVIRFHPSDAFLDFAAALGAGDVNQNIVDGIEHGVVPSPASRA